jgi:hypothetical protein
VHNLDGQRDALTDADTKRDKAARKAVSAHHGEPRARAVDAALDVADPQPQTRNGTCRRHSERHDTEILATERIFQDDGLLIRRRFGFPASPKLEEGCSRKTTLIWP